MTRFTMVHEFECSVDDFWGKVFFDRALNDGMFRKALAFPEYTLLELRETDAEVYRKVSVTPKMDLPGAVAKVLGPNFRYTEETYFDKPTRKCTYKAIPSVLADKMTTEGAFRVEPMGPKRCRRYVDSVIEARVMIVGGLLESTAEKSVRDGYDKGAVYMNQWIREQGL